MDQNLKAKAVSYLNRTVKFNNISYAEQIVEEHYANWKPREHNSFPFIDDLQLFFFDADAIKKEAKRIQKERSNN